jgi:hypothetical protein
MKSVLNRALAFAFELLAALVARIGCSKHKPAKPEIHWHGPATGYEDTTKPDDPAAR